MCTALIASGWLAQSRVLAQSRRTARFVYLQGAGAEACPSEAEVARAVEERLGYDPFDERSLFLLLVTMSGADGSLRAEIELRQPDREPGQRELHTAAGSCDELAELLVLALSIAIDPRVALRPAPSRRGPVEVTSSTRESDEQEGGARVAAEPEPAQPVPVSDRTDLEDPAQVRTEVEPAATVDEPPSAVTAAVLVGGGGSLSSAPALVPLLRFGVELRWRALRVGLAGRLQLLGAMSYGGGTVSGAPSGAELWACGQLDAFFACGLAVAGVFVSNAHALPNARTIYTSYLAPGARAGAELRLTAALSLRASLDVLVPVLRTRIAVAGHTVWTMPAVSCSATLGLVLHLP